MEPNLKMLIPGGLIQRLNQRLRDLVSGDASPERFQLTLLETS